MDYRCTALSSICLMATASVVAPVGAGEPLTLTMSVSQDRIADIEPLYLTIRAQNTSGRDAELPEPFSSEYGDVTLYCRKAATGDFWQQIELSESAGRVNAIRPVPPKIRAGDFIETIECVIPATFAKSMGEQEWELQAHFRRKGGLVVVSDLAKTAVVPDSSPQPATLRAVTGLIKEGATRDLKPEEAKALKLAAVKSAAIARALDLCNRFRDLREFDKARDQRPAIEEFAALVEKLPAIEREYWAYQFANLHFLAASRLLNREDRHPPQVTFHLDTCAALDKSLGTTTEKARGIRYSCAAYRKRLAQ